MGRIPWMSGRVSRLSSRVLSRTINFLSGCTPLESFISYFIYLRTHPNHIYTMWSFICRSAAYFKETSIAEIFYKALKTIKNFPERSMNIWTDADIITGFWHDTCTCHKGVYIYITHFGDNSSMFYVLTAVIICFVRIVKAVVNQITLLARWNASTIIARKSWTDVRLCKTKEI